MYKSLKSQPLFQQQRSYPDLVSSSEDRCLIVFIFRSFPAILFSLHLAGPSPTRSHSTILQSSCRYDLQIIHRFVVPCFDVLRQCCCHWPWSSVPPRPPCTRRTLLTPDLGFARRDIEPAPPILKRAPAPAPVVVSNERRLRKFKFLSASLYEEDFANL
jgi:hypothetical protein